MKYIFVSEVRATEKNINFAQRYYQKIVLHSQLSRELLTVGTDKSHKNVFHT